MVYREGTPFTDKHLLTTAYKQAMNAMDDTIAGAASGETVQDAAPKDSQSQAKGQKSNE